MYQPFQLVVIEALEKKFQIQNRLFCIKYGDISEIHVAENWEAMQNFPLFFLPWKWLVLVTSECHANKISGQSFTCN